MTSFAFVFPGQGSQSVGMLKGYDGLPEIEAVRMEAAGALGEDFLALLDDGPAEKLNLTVNTQPAMVTAGYAAFVAPDVRLTTEELVNVELQSLRHADVVHPEINVVGELVIFLHEGLAEIRQAL